MKLKTCWYVIQHGKHCMLVTSQKILEVLDVCLTWLACKKLQSFSKWQTDCKKSWTITLDMPFFCSGSLCSTGPSAARCPPFLLLDPNSWTKASMRLKIGDRDFSYSASIKCMRSEAREKGRKSLLDFRQKSWETVEGKAKKGQIKKWEEWREVEHQKGKE